MQFSFYTFDLKSYPTSSIAPDFLASTAYYIFSAETLADSPDHSIYSPRYLEIEKIKLIQ